MKKTMLFLGIIVFSMTLASCDVSSNSNGSNTVPTYEGMAISTSSSQSSSIKSPKLKDNEDTAGDTTIEEDIEDIVTIDVVTDDEVKYYVEPNESFDIEIYLTNPNQYEIQSFTLNGKKYSSYMFEDGSTMELLKLKTTAPQTSGYFTYSLDAIKYIDGTDIKDVDLEGDKDINVGVIYSNAPTASITSSDISTTSIQLGVDIEDNNSLIGDYPLEIYLTNGEEIIDKKTLLVGQNDILFNNLTMNTAYEYGIVTQYDLCDGRDVQEYWLLTDTFNTLNVFSFSEIIPTYDSVGFDLETHGITGELTSITITDPNTETIVSTASSIADRSFSALLSNHKYVINIYFTYLINNETINSSTSQEFRTLAKSEPILTIEDIEATQSSITFNVFLNDLNSVSSIEKIELYKGDSLVDTLSPINEYEFTDLESNTKYTIVLEYSYDLNDGQGIQTGSVTQTKWTSPFVSFDSIRCLNTTAVSEGDIIVIQANVVNPDGVDFTTVVINNVEYPVSNVSTSTKIRVELSNEGQFEGGSTDLTISEIKGTLNDQIVLMTIEQNNVANVFINGALSVESVQFVDTDMNPTDYCFVNDEVKVLITLDNPTGYDLTQINDDSDLVLNEIDDNHYYIDYTSYTSSYGTKSFSLSDLSYSNEYMSKTLSFSNMSAGMIVCQDGIKQISTADDLLDMDDCYYYELENDIDLAGEDWSTPGSMYGVFNGNNYSIKNMSSVNTFSDTDLNLGLFSSTDAAYVFDLNIEDALYMITLNGEESSVILAGGLFAKISGDYCKIENVDINIEISITNNSTNGTSDSITGGMIGYLNNDGGTINLKNNTTTSTIDSNGNCTGGMIGNLHNNDNGTMNIENSITMSTIDSTGDDTGGMIGKIFNDGPLYFGSNTTTSTIDSTAIYSTTGGMIGGFDGYKTMNFDNNTTTVTIDSTSNYTGGMIGNLYNGGTMNFDDNTATSIIDSTGKYTGGMIGNLYNGGTMNIINCEIYGQMNSGGALVGSVEVWGKYSVSGCKCNITINGELITSIPDECTIES